MDDPTEGRKTPHEIGQTAALTPVADTGKDDAKECVSNCKQRQLLTPAELVAKFGVSPRTARRMIKRGTWPVDMTGYYGNRLPARTVGSDGKSYPSRRQAYKRSRIALHASMEMATALRYARHGLRKADAVGCERGVTEHDVRAICEIADTATEMAARWQSAMTGGSNHD